MASVPESTTIHGGRPNNKRPTYTRKCAEVAKDSHNNKIKKLKIIDMALQKL